MKGVGAHGCFAFYGRQAKEGSLKKINNEDPALFKQI